MKNKIKPFIEPSVKEACSLLSYSSICPFPTSFQIPHMRSMPLWSIKLLLHEYISQSMHGNQSTLPLPSTQHDPL